MSGLFARRGEGESAPRWAGLGLPVVGALAMLLAAAGVAAAGPSGTILLGESFPRGGASQVRVELKGQGLVRQGPGPGAVKEGAKMPKPLSIEVETRLVFYERVLEVAGDAAALQIGGGTGGAGGTPRGRPRKTVRQVMQAAAALNGDIRRQASSLRPEVSLLVAERRREDGPVVVVSPAGPLSRSELELVEVEGDPLALTDLLPNGAVASGQTWRIGTAAAMGISGYDVISRNAVDATLESFDEVRARVRIRGRIEGSYLGAPGAFAFEGLLDFDRQMGWIDRVEIRRNEIRQAGPVEAGLDIKSTLTMTRQADRPPATLSDSALSSLSLEVTPQGQMLVEHGPGDRAAFLHDRSWHVFWADPKTTVLKRLDAGRVVAQCNLVVGPPAGRGRHQDSGQFRDEVRRVLGSRFVNYIGMGEVDGDPAGGYRFKVGVQGRDGDLGIVWYYYLIASPAGEQLVATYTMTARDSQAFGEQDVEMMRTLRWLPARQADGRK